MDTSSSPLLEALAQLGYNPGGAGGYDPMLAMMAGIPPQQEDPNAPADEAGNLAGGGQQLPGADINVGQPGNPDNQTQFGQSLPLNSPPAAGMYPATRNFATSEPGEQGPPPEGQWPNLPGWQPWNLPFPWQPVM